MSARTIFLVEDVYGNAERRLQTILERVIAKSVDRMFSRRARLRLWVVSKLPFILKQWWADYEWKRAAEQRRLRRVDFWDASVRDRYTNVVIAEFAWINKANDVR